MNIVSSLLSHVSKPLALTIALVAVAAPSTGFAGGRNLSVDDVVQIKVVSQPDLDTTARVETDGTLNFPYVGRIRVVGRSQDQVAHIIADKLKQAEVVKDPQVLVELTNFGTQATVQGQVGTPGAFALDRPTTLTQLLSKAGGVKEPAGDVIIRRPSKRGWQIFTYASRDLSTGKINGERIRVFNNDEVFVDAAPIYYLYGFVNKAGEFPLDRVMTVQQALAAGGGVGSLGSDWRIQIKRVQPDGTTIEISASLDDVVHPNDVIVVNERIF